MKKVCLIKQPAGLGDIFFTQKIVDQVLSQGYAVIWPVISQYEWVRHYIVRDNLVFVNEDQQFPYKDVYTSNVINIINQDNFMYLPLMFADRFFPDEKTMLAKYRFSGISHDKWQDFLVFRRNKRKEDELFYDVLNLKDEDEYILCNQEYGPPPNTKRYAIEGLPKKTKRIDISLIDGFTLFDWAKTIERATELHIAHTSMQYFMENLNISANVLKSYAYGGQNQYDQVADLFTYKKWDWVIND